MASGYATTLQQVKTILDGISSSTLPVKFDYFETMPTSLPAGYVIINGGSERAIDTANNDVGVSLLLMAIFAPEESSGAALKWAQCLDAITAEFRKESNRSLAGNAYNLTIDEIPKPSFTTEFGMPAMVFSVRLTAKMLKSTQ